LIHFYKRNVEADYVTAAGVFLAQYRLVCQQHEY